MAEREQAGSVASGDPIEGSACLVGQSVIFGGTDGVVRSLEAATGKVQWTYDTKGEIKGGLTPFTAPGEGASSGGRRRGGREARRSAAG